MHLVCQPTPKGRGHKKCVGTDPDAKHENGPPGGDLCVGSDGPRHRAGQPATWRRSSSSSVYIRTVRAWGRTVRDRVEGLLLHENPRTRPGRDPVEGESS
jgi:hypothetical protein